jgi:MoxR-like ATPase
MNKALAHLRVTLGSEDAPATESTAAAIYHYFNSKDLPANKVCTPDRRLGRGIYTLVNLGEPVPAATGAAKTPASGVKKAARKKSESSLAGLKLPEAPPAQSAVEPPKSADVIQLPTSRARSLQQHLDSLVPAKDPTYVPFGAFRDIASIINSKIFYPVFITGLSGNGKTVMVEQACAKLGRECIKVSITEETDEDDLLGGNTLVDGNVIYREGPVLTAMRRGAVLILDEVDLNATKILCLQSIMEGKPFFNKKTGETVYPIAGFNIFATANTKGRGSETGRFVGTKMMNEAFLERFPITVEQEYPGSAVEKKILEKNFTVLGVELNDTTQKFVDALARWAEVIRKSFEEQAVDDVISTRRLVAVAKAYAIFGDRMKALDLCLSRFDKDTKESFIQLYTKLDAQATTAEKGASVIDPDAIAV